MPLIIGEKTDRLPIVVSSGSIERIIDVPGLEDGRALTQADAIYKALNDWGLLERTEALCCDTTNANLGGNAGAALILEQILDKSLLYLPCRHHVYEIILSGIFNNKFSIASGLNVPIFKRFQRAWPDIDEETFKDGRDNIHPALIGRIQETTAFIKDYLNKQLPRDDYRELLKLSLIFLGEAADVTFRKPGAYHLARWMHKAIDCLKMYLFRDSFPLKLSGTNGLFQLCQFIVFE